MPIYKIEGEKKDGLQKYRVVVNYTGKDGKKHTIERREYGKAQAERAEAQMRAEAARINESEEERRTKLTLRGLFEIYEKEHGPEVRKTTMEKKKSILNNGVMPKLGDVMLRDLTVTALSDWKVWLNEKTTPDGAPLKTATKNAAYRELKALLNFALARGMIEKNPLPRLGPFRDPYQENIAVRLRYYTAEEFKLFISEAEKEAEQKNDLRASGLYIFFLFAYYTGMRKGEINGLRWSDIEDTKYIWVRRSIAQKVKGETWTETPPKNQSSVRRIQMPGTLVDALSKHRERQERAGRWSEALFICGGPAPIPDTSIENANKLYGQRAGVKHITIHEFRHSHASLLCNAGVNIKEIARRLGHANVEITLKTYSHLYPKEEERAVSVLDQL